MASYAERVLFKHKKTRGAYLQEVQMALEFHWKKQNKKTHLNCEVYLGWNATEKQIGSWYYGDNICSSSEKKKNIFFLLTIS